MIIDDKTGRVYQGPSVRPVDDPEYIAVMGEAEAKYADEADRIRGEVADSDYDYGKMPNRLVVARHNQPEDRRCVATSRSTGERCKNWKVGDSDRCVVHRGHNSGLKGIMSNRYKTGKSSKYMPAGMLALYEESFNDRSLIEMRNDAAVIQAMIHKELEKIGDKSDARAETWTQLKKLRKELLKAKGNPTLANALLAEMLALIGSVDDSDYWDGVIKLTEQRRKIVTAEVDRMVKAAQFVKVEKAMALVVQMVDIVARYVDDVSIMTKIKVDVSDLFQRAEI